MNNIITKQAAMRDRQTIPHKRCNGPCKDRKPHSAFAQNTKRDGTKTPRSICKACDNEKQAVYRARVKADRKAFQEERARLAQERAEAAETVNESPESLPAALEVKPEAPSVPTIACESCTPGSVWVNAGCKVHGLGLVIDTRERPSRSSLEAANGLYGY